jgi:hypothetical protein
MKIVIRRDENEMEATYEVNEREQTVADLKEIISANQFGPAVEEQRLELKNGRRLKNSHFLAYYGVKANDVLVLKQQSASSSSSNSSTPSASDDESANTANQSNATPAASTSEHQHRF